DASAGPAGSLDRASYRLIAVNVEAAKSYRVLRAVLNLAAEQVSPDGSVLVAGPKKGGAEVAATRLRDLFEQVELLTYRKGHRVYRGTRPLAMPTPPLPGAAMPDAEQPLTVWLRGLELHLIQDDRIFARGQLDPATRMLAEVMEILPGADVLDLGCGGGVLGILAARLQPSSHCTLVDSDPLAVAAARRGAALSDADNASVHLSDVLDDLPGQTFDVVVMNPPFHRGRHHDLALADRFLAAASAALRPGGKLWVVCNRFQPFERTLTALLGPVREMAGDASYKVLVAERTEQ
ncbi:MAG: class I SAM-dependent methyltransferase, partial [Chloroflexota bacterium]